MDTAPVYDLRDRLRAAAIAGTNLLSEDFRLKHAYEAFQPLEKVSHVFAKIGQLTGQLLSLECHNPQGTLLDTITLADSVICTLGMVEVAGNADPVGMPNIDRNESSKIVNAPYSTLKVLLEALATPGDRHYETVCIAHEKQPELFRDYRVKDALVQALGLSHASIADKAEQWLTENGDQTVLPALYRDFDPEGGKEMARRVRVISRLAGARANTFYVRMLDEAQGDVRLELIDALRHDPRNLTLLFALSKAEKGKNRDMVYELLAGMQDEKVGDFFMELAEKKPKTVLKYIRNATTDWSAELMSDFCDKLLEKLRKVNSVPEKKKQELLELLSDTVRAVFGKGGTRLCACYRKLLVQKEAINAFLEEVWPKSNYADCGCNILQNGVLTSSVEWYGVEGLDIEATLGKVLHHSLIVNPDPDLETLAMELYQNGDSGQTNVKFLPAAVTVKFSEEASCSEHFTDWLERQIPERELSVSGHEGEYLKAVIEAADYIYWNKDSYKLHGKYVDLYFTNRKDKSIERTIKLPHAKEFLRWLAKHGTSQTVNRILASSIPLEDKEFCREMGEYFYRRALTCLDDMRYKLVFYMKYFGWTDCTGLAVSAVKNDLSIWTGALYNWLVILPEDKDKVMEEMRTICHMVKSGALKAENLDLADLESRMETWYKRDKKEV